MTTGRVVHLDEFLTLRIEQCNEQNAAMLFCAQSCVISGGERDEEGFSFPAFDLLLLNDVGVSPKIEKLTIVAKQI
jgi:hypothetical protein